ncbi:GMC family oxidoreductase [Paenibacillus solisilvae]|uniref:GMC family oxidoreductase n=1 Tax=Paenibacillus solisilvae TaxID=2486751 RepID=A0ABW0VVI3_9BACL
MSRSEFPEVLGPLNILVPGTAERLYQIQIQGPGPYRFNQFQVQPLQNELEIAMYSSGKVESRFDNFVTLDPLEQDEYVIPALNVRFSYSERDLEIAQQMSEGMKRTAAAMNAPLREIDGQTLNLGIPGGDHHEMGTCRMGDDPNTSGTNRYGQIHGVQGLYVADNSVIPTCGTANPTLTCAALAIRTADYIAEQLKRS